MHSHKLFAAFLLVAGCGSSSADTDASGAGGGGAGGGSTSTSATTATTGTGGGSATTGAGGEGGVFEGPGVTGVIRDEAGAPLATLVLMCQADTCFYAESGANGRFSFAAEPPVDVAVKTEEHLDSSPRLGAALVPVKITGTDPIDLGDVLVPTLPAGAMLASSAQDPQTLAVGDGLELTVNKADLSAPLGFALIDLAARAIAPENQHPIPGLEAEEVLAVYALHPFSGSSESPMAVRAPSDLPAGTAVNFRTISWLDGHLSPAAKGHADGTHVTTDASEGILDITYLVISK